MPAEVEAGQDWSQSGGERPPQRQRERVATDLAKGLTRSVQTRKNNSLQCRPRKEIRDRARSYPERRWTLSISWSALRFWSG